MSELRLGVVEYRFAELVWNHAPISSGDLVRLCQKELDWKKSTTYTVLKKLCEKGIFKNENALVQTCISREEYMSGQSRQFVEETFDGSLPAFLTAFSSGKGLSEQEVTEIREMLDSYS